MGGEKTLRYEIKLKTSSDVLRLIQRTVNALNRGEVDTTTARTMLYGASVASQTIKNLELELKIEELERIAQEMRK